MLQYVLFFCFNFVWLLHHKQASIFLGGVVGGLRNPYISGDRKKACSQGFAVGYQWQYALDMMQGGVEDQ